MKLGNDDYKAIQATAGKILENIDGAARGIFDEFTDPQIFRIQEAVEKVLIEEKKKR